MLSQLEVGQFHAFGFMVLRNCLSEDEFEQVEKAYTRLIATAPRYDYFSNIGTRMTSSFVYEDESLGNLIEHSKVMEAMRDIWGTECLYLGGQDMWENRDYTPWHCDGKPAQDTVTLKTALYLDEQDKDTGSLNVIPGSHHPDFSATLFQSCGYWEKNGGRPRLKLDPENIPGALSLHTQPGDVILWNNHIWHSAFKRKDGLPRRTLFIGYMPDPGNDLLKILELRNQVKQHLSEDRPYLYNEQMMRNASPARNKMVARLEELGVENVRSTGKPESRKSRRPENRTAGRSDKQKA